MGVVNTGCLMPAHWADSDCSRRVQSRDTAPHRAPFTLAKPRIWRRSGQPLGDELRVGIDEFVGGLGVAHPVHRDRAGDRVLILAASQKFFTVWVGLPDPPTWSRQQPIRSTVGLCSSADNGCTELQSTCRCHIRHSHLLRSAECPNRDLTTANRGRTPQLCRWSTPMAKTSLSPSPGYVHRGSWWAGSAVLCRLMESGQPRLPPCFGAADLVEGEEVKAGQGVVGAAEGGGQCVDDPIGPVPAG
jgi:hypothetical protein